ncbi:AfsR/SARP family transcriptional regulator [Micromonospora costi]|uniref:AfsR/SARP family transcriptional regulator n=1 Tax=Micromonospora costi TaxID=1530042 RepID=A0A3B0AFY4_9ACTN|nr:BTAD domain-containing putative transcriptional regulator [Micromonospora costi]RKN58597.1 AfsR/SARP family transcriptional regulator [Micromonospora costi]
MTAELILLAGVSHRGREITGARLRGLLALLAGDLRAGCGTGRLIAGLWPDELPENPAKALQVLVSRARAQLGADVIERTHTGYRLTLTEEQVDAAAVRGHAAAAAERERAGDHAAALAHAEAGLANWVGPPEETDPGDDPLAALRAERAATYRTLARALALALARLGRHAEAVGPLGRLAADRPRDEEVLAELLRAEAATAGPSAALARYEAYRRRLRDDLGSDPGPALQAVQRDLLRGESPTVRQGVSHEPNPMLGRDADIAAVTGLLRTARVTSVVGPGGLGKTRLANLVARQAEQRVVHLVPLAGVRTDDDVVPEVAAALGVGESLGAAASARTGGGRDGPAGIAAALGPGPALLVLDNCEHVVRGAAELVGGLVSATRDVRVLTTSRTPLGLSSESVYLLPELTLDTSVELFRQRARAARPGVELPADVVTALCRHLDGLPLAVELAAARVRTMSVAEIAGRLDDRFALLRGGSRDAPQRHHTLHSVVDWSWNLLDEASRAAMRALSVFPGGFTADAARSLVDGDPLPVLEHLVDQSLLKVDETPTGVRLRMLETVREFSAARRDEAGETGVATDRFLAWARGLGLRTHEALLGPEAFGTAELVRAEQDNIVQAYRIGLARDDAATVAATGAVLAGIWTLDTAYTRMVALAEETGPLLSHYRPAAEFVEVTRTVSALSAANLMMIQGPRPIRPLVTLRRLPPPSPATLVGALAILLDALPAIAADRAALDALRARPEPLVACFAHCLASYVHEREGDRASALDAARRLVDGSDVRVSPWFRILAHSRFAELLVQTEEWGQARHHLLAALRLLEETGPWTDVIQIRWTLALACLATGDVDEAERWLDLAARDSPDDGFGLASFEAGVRGEVRLVRGDVEGGLTLWRQAVTHVTLYEDPLFQADPAGAAAWAFQVRAAAAVAHARHGRLDLVPTLPDELADGLHRMLANSAANPPAFVTEQPICGTLLLALAIVDIGRARRGDRAAAAGAARLVALAERFGFLREFQPTMSSARARRDAEQADRAAYADAVSAYAGLEPAELRAAALSALAARAGGHRDGSRS